MRMRVLVTWASKRGGTEGIGRVLADSLAKRGHEVVAIPVDRVDRLESFGALIVGGALYANRWPWPARRFVNRNAARLRRVPVWFFSSGPLDDSADRDPIPPPTEVAVLAERVGALGHATFGGRLEADAKGFPASAMAKKKSGDWRDAEQIDRWAADIAAALPAARPGEHIDHPAHSIGRLLAHAGAASLGSAAALATLVRLIGVAWTLGVGAVLALAIAATLARSYFRARGVRDPLSAAIAWALVAAALDFATLAVVATESLEPPVILAATVVLSALTFVAVWIVGSVSAMLPSKRATRGHDAPPPVGDPATGQRSPRSPARPAAR
jgi:menaquinone-dependent protoporphyrinogen oxidase